MEASRTASVRQYNLRSDPSESCAGKRKPGAGTRLPLLDYLCYYYTITIPAYSLGTFSWLPYQQKGCPEEFSRAYRVFPSLVDNTHSLLLLMLLSHSFEQPSRPSTAFFIFVLPEQSFFATDLTELGTYSCLQNF